MVDHEHDEIDDVLALYDLLLVRAKDDGVITLSQMQEGWRELNRLFEEAK